MKFLALLFLFGIALAAPYDALEDAVDEAVMGFMAGLEHSPSLEDTLGLYNLASEDAEEEVKNELEKNIGSVLTNLLNKIKDAFAGKGVFEWKIVEKVRVLIQKLKDLHAKLPQPIQILLQLVKEQAKNYFTKLLQKLILGAPEARSLDKDNKILHSYVMDKFRQLKDYLKEKIDKEALKKKIIDLFGIANEVADYFFEILKNHTIVKARDMILEFIDKTMFAYQIQMLEERSVGEIWDNVKNYFDGLMIPIKEKQANFGEWVKDKIGKLLDKGASRVENLKKMLQQVTVHLKEFKKEFIVEAVEFFDQFKEELGSKYNEFKETAKEILKKKE